MMLLNVDPMGGWSPLKKSIIDTADDNLILVPTYLIKYLLFDICNGY